MSFKASHKFAQMSAQKIRPFADLIRGKYVDIAKEILSCYPNRGARLIEAVLNSAMANADSQGHRNIDSLEITDIRIDSGPIAKRFRPKARGMSSPIKKRSAHISITLDD